MRLLITILTAFILTGCNTSEVSVDILDSNDSNPSIEPPPKSGNSTPSGLTYYWTWINGSDLANANPTYGSSGVFDSAYMPGGRNGAVIWSDNNGDIYLFGGSGIDSVAGDGRLSDLWKYDTSENTWAYLGGPQTHTASGNWGTRRVASPTNWPSGRSTPAYTTDSSGNLWMYGGTGLDSTDTSGRLGDLWKFDVSIHQWTWMAGTNLADVPAVNVSAGLGVYDPGNSPNRRYAGFAFYNNSTDEFYLFGGSTASWYTWQNDMWSYSVALDQWADRYNSPASSRDGTYGTKGVEAPTNWPGARHYGASGVNPIDGTFYVFGGEGRSATGSEWVLSDLWRYNPTNGQWTWLSGTTSVGDAGIYGTKNIGDSANHPGGRFAINCASFDSSGNFWLYGGYGKDGTGVGDVGLGDLWKYDHSNQQWIWVHGSDIGNPANNHGIINVGGDDNTPGSSDNHTLFTIDDKVYLFGPAGKRNSLWSFTP